MKASYQLNLIIIGICFILYVPFLVSPQEIKIKTEKGIPVVYNPKKPAPPPGVKCKLVLEEELCLGDQEEEYLFSEKADYISTAIDNDWNIFTLDPKLVEIRKYDRTGKLLKTFGKKGNGPEEMDRPSNMMITPQNELMFVDNGNSRIMFFSLEGDYLSYIPTYKLRLRRIKIDSQGHIVADIMEYSQDENKERKVTYAIKRFNEELEPVFTIFSLDITENFMKSIEGRQYTFGPDTYWQRTEEDNVIIGDNRNYEFAVINPEGKIIKRIKKEYDPAEVSKEDIESLPDRVKKLYTIAKHHKGFYYFTIDEDGRIFARTWERTKENRGYYYDVFDPEGRYIAKIPINAFIKRWIGGRLLTVEETEEGFPVVKLYKVSWQ